MTCPRCHGRLIQERGERWCLMCGYIEYADVVDAAKAREEREQHHGNAVRRPMSQGVRL